MTEQEVKRREVSIRLALDSLNALVTWRRRWERKYGSPPTASCGHGDELTLWRMAGRLMRARGQKPRMPG